MGHYKDLEIYQLAFKLAIETHHLSLKLPKHELYEQGGQVRRSTKSIKDNIVEGYGRRRYKAEYIRFLIFSHASCDEAISQLEMINDLYFSNDPITDLIDEYNILGSKINKFIQYVEKNWNATRNPQPETRNPQPETRNSKPATRIPKPETRNP